MTHVIGPCSHGKDHDDIATAMMDVDVSAKRLQYQTCFVFRAPTMQKNQGVPKSLHFHYQALFSVPRFNHAKNGMPKPLRAVPPCGRWCSMRTQSRQALNLRSLPLRTMCAESTSHSFSLLVVRSIPQSLCPPPSSSLPVPRPHACCPPTSVLPLRLSLSLSSLFILASRMCIRPRAIAKVCGDMKHPTVRRHYAEPYPGRVAVLAPPIAWTKPYQMAPSRLRLAHSCVAMAHPLVPSATAELNRRWWRTGRSAAQPRQSISRQGGRPLQNRKTRCRSYGSLGRGLGSRGRQCTASGSQ